MIKKNLLLQQLNLKYPVFGYSPAGNTDMELSVRLSNLGGIGLADLQSLSDNEVSNLIAYMNNNVKSDSFWGIRLDNERQIDIIRDKNLKIPIIILPFEPEEAYARDLRNHAKFIVAEVTSLYEAEKRQNLADFFLVKGNESGGIVGEKSTFVLIQEFYESGMPYIIQGGFGLFNISGALLGNAISVVLDSQLYLLDDCPLDDKVKKYLGDLQIIDTYLAGETLDCKYRVTGKIANKGVSHLKKLEQDFMKGELPGEWRDVLNSFLKHQNYFKDQHIKNSLLPVGQDVQFASYIGRKFKTLDSYLKGIKEIFNRQIETANVQNLFDNNLLANEHNLRYPIFQGPMAKISDNMDFAEKIVQNGGFPVFALGNLFKDEGEEILKDAANKSNPSIPYGCGIIGLSVNKERYEEHIELIEKYKPDAVWIAAGSIQLAERIGNMGIPVFFHTPVPELFMRACESDVHCIILEGAECGGHIGNITSFVLWESFLQYVEQIKNSLNKKIRVIFAGGIGSSLSSAIVSIITALHRDSLSVGIQLGTAYLFTEEIVETGALSEQYRKLLIKHDTTRVIGSTVNTRARVLPTKCIDETIERELSRIQSGISLQERKKLYERDNLGGLLLAAKGRKFNTDFRTDNEEPVYLCMTGDEQINCGCYMSGEIVSLFNKTITIEELHYNLAVKGKEIIMKYFEENNWVAGKRSTTITEKDDKEKPVYECTNGKVAIVGMGCVLPDAPNIDDYWKNIITKRYSITEIPPDRWDTKIYYSPDRKAPEKSYTKIGAFVNGFNFDSKKYGIPPLTSKTMDNVQKMAIVAAAQALKDAGIPVDGKKQINAGVIVGNTLGGDSINKSNRRIFIQELLELIDASSPDQVLDDDEIDRVKQIIEDKYIQNLPIVNGDTFPGELPNIIAGRIANTFNLCGKNMVVDAACASSLAALDTAINGLLSGDYDMALAGGVEGSMDPSYYIKFCKLGALSATGSRPFDADADGFVMGEGCGFLVLKRLKDALKDDDNIYAVISGVGSSSDGKGKGITAPNPAGQKLAIKRALKKSGIKSSDISYIETHGTSTNLGDPVELEVLSDVFGKRNADKIAIGSVKSQIGHLKAAAGMAGLIKTILALKNKVLPPSINFNNPNPKIDWNNAPFYVNTEVTNWERKNGSPRKAGVSSFGFGGTNYHVILEEYAPEGFTYKSTSQMTEKENQQKVCFMFSGQGSQYVGMLQELYSVDDSVRKTLDEAEKISKDFGGFSLIKILFGDSDKSKNENEDILRDTLYTQPALFVVEMALFRYLKKRGIKPDAVAGHSLGEYSALCAAGVISFSDGLKAVMVRGAAMKKAGSNSPGSMAAVITSREVVDGVTGNLNKGYATAANYNSPEQTVISGDVEGVDEACKIFEKMGIKTIRLNVSTAFHSEIVKDAAFIMNPVLDSMTFLSPEIPVYSNVTGKRYPENSAEIRNILKQQIISPVRWNDLVEEIHNDGVKIFVEVGPKKALYGFTRKILEHRENAGCFYTLLPGINTRETLEKTINELKEIQAPDFWNQKENIAMLPIISSEGEPAKFFHSDDELTCLMESPWFEDYFAENLPIIKTFLKHGYSIYKERRDIEEKKSIPQKVLTEKIFITGVGAGFPGKNRNVFDDSNFEELFDGRCFIEEVDDETKENILNKNITRLIKKPDGSSQFNFIDDITGIIKFAGQLGNIDDENDFCLDKKFLKTLDTTYRLAICAGYEALRDAGIPLVQSQKITSSGNRLPGPWILPDELQDETGVVFASAFPGHEKLIQEISEHLTWIIENKKKQEIKEFFGRMIDNISDPVIKNDMAHLLDKKITEMEDKEWDRYKFSQNFILQVLSMGHAHFAQLIRAKGPNTHINAACASGTQALGIAEDWIKTGRCNRVIIITADNITNPVMMPWFGAGFLASGAASIENDINDAILPFGKGRNGIILGSGATGMVLEKESSSVKRGLNPGIDVVKTYIANSAFHPTRLDAEHITGELEKFISSVEKEFHIPRREIAGNGLFMSHESFSPAKGGSAETEAAALKSVLGSDAKNIIITNTKCFIGHTLGTAMEDVLTVKSLQSGRIPPIINRDKVDPVFNGLKFSGGEKRKIKYGLRFAAGFGSQLCFTLFRNNLNGGDKFNSIYSEWLNNLGGSREHLFVDGRILKIHTNGITDKKTVNNQPKEQETKTGTVSDISSSSGEIREKLLNIICKETGYEPEDLEDSFKLEEDLGIDSLKQAEILGLIRKEYDLPKDENLNIYDYPTINDISRYIEGRISCPTGDDKPSTNEIPSPADTGRKFNTRDKLVEIICKETGYEPEDLEDSFKLEEDLGIDSLKQAEILGLIRKEYDLPKDENLNIYDYPTINDISQYIEGRLSENKKETGGSSDENTVVDEGTTVVEADEKDIIRIKKVEPIPIPPADDCRTMKLQENHIIIIDINSPAAGSLSGLFTSENISHEVYNLVNEEQGLSGNKDCSSILILLPEDESALSLSAPEIYEKLFRVLRNVDLTKETKITDVSCEDFFGLLQGVNPFAGGITALIKTLHKEYGMPVKHIYSSDTQIIFNELKVWDGFKEVTFNRGQRYSLSETGEIDANEFEHTPSFSGQDVLLVTGGARGITFECLKGLFDGMEKPRLIIFGRTPIPEDGNRLALLLDNPVETRKHIREKLQNKFEKITPVMIENEFNKLEKQVKLVENLGSLKNLGFELKYYSVDIADRASVESALENAEAEFSAPVTGIIHGAGIEESKLFNTKDPLKSQRIVSIKTDGIWNILKAVSPENIKRLVCFSSITGRYGNYGQIDYSFANGYLSRLCWKLQQKNLNALAIDWSAWEGAGMAVESGTVEIMKSRGITPIPLKTGTNIMKKVFHSRINGEIIISGERGTADEDPFVNAYPMVDHIEAGEQSAVGIRMISGTRDLYIDNHRFRNVPLVPGVMGIEAAAQVYRLSTGKDAEGFTDVNFTSAIKLLNSDQKELRMVLNKNEDEIVISSIFLSKANNKQIEKEHFSFKVCSSADFELSKQHKRIPPFEIPIMNRNEVYDFFERNSFYLGGCFQVIEKVIMLNAREMTTKVRFPGLPLFDPPGYVLYANPLAIEAGLQTASLFCSLVKSTISLPSTIDKILILSHKRPAYVNVIHKQYVSNHNYFDVIVADKDNDPVIIMENLALIDADIVTDKPPVVLEIEMHLNLTGSLKETDEIEILAVNSVRRLLEANPDFVPENLSNQEMKRFSEISHRERKIQYISGVIAIKELAGKHGIDVHKMEIQRDEYGKPYLCDKTTGAKLPFEISISHSGEFAAVVLSENPVGIDIQEIREFNDVLLEEAFTESEREQINNDSVRALQFWSVKEAIVKLLGGIPENSLDCIQLEIKRNKDFQCIFSDKLMYKVPLKAENIGITTCIGVDFILTLARKRE